MPNDSIVIVGSSRAIEEAAAALRPESWTVSVAETLSNARGEIQNDDVQLVVIDTDLVDQAPWQVVEELRDLDPLLAIVLLVSPETPWASPASYRHRPAGILKKPVDQTSLVMAVDSALVYRRLLEENRVLKRQLGSAVSLRDWVGCTPESQEVRKSIATAALSSGPVLLIGEDGTGRRLAAELLHRHGRQPSATMLPLDLTGLPAGELGQVLSEVRDAAGGGTYVHGARPGSLYLAEVTALDAADQRALADFLEAPLSLRVMGSATPSIEQAVANGAFDRRTFQLLSRIKIQIPALRERRGDVPVLIDHFLKLFCERFELQRLGIPSSSIENYSSYDWPGNVAELSMMIERAVSIASAAKFDGATLPEHFCSPPSLTVPEPNRLKDVSLRELIADIEKRIILQTLERVDGSQKRAAEQLRINPTTLHEKMKRYKILPERSRQRV